jgi:hypothetical protein
MRGLLPSCSDWRVVGSLAVLLLCGCGGGYSSVNMQGKVSVQGQTASAGFITFAPTEAGLGKGGLGSIQEDGSYRLERVPVGRVTFQIAPQKKTGKKVETTGPTGVKSSTDEVVSMLKATGYSQGQATLTLDVTSEMASHDFTLDAK